MSIELGVLLAVISAVASFAGAWGGNRARLSAVERNARHAHRRIDEHLNQHLEGSL